MTTCGPSPWLRSFCDPNAGPAKAPECRRPHTPFELPPSGSSPAGRELAEQLVEQARAEGVDLVGPGGLPGGLTKRVREVGLEAEMSDHLGYDEHDPAGRDGGNSRNGPAPRR